MFGIKTSVTGIVVVGVGTFFVPLSRERAAYKHITKYVFKLLRGARSWKTLDMVMERDERDLSIQEMNPSDTSWWIRKPLSPYIVHHRQQKLLSRLLCNAQNDNLWIDTYWNTLWASLCINSLFMTVLLFSAGSYIMKQFEQLLTCAICLDRYHANIHSVWNGVWMVWWITFVDRLLFRHCRLGTTLYRDLFT